MQCSVIFVFFTLSVVEGFIYGLQDCPAIEAQNDFEIHKFLGKWYYIQKTKPVSACGYEDFRRAENGTFYFEQHEQASIFGISTEYNYAGKLTVPDDKVRGSMILTLPFRVFPISYTIFKTDYENYAGVLSCQKVGFYHRYSIIILSRKQSLHQVFIEEINDKLTSAQIDPSKMMKISHMNCKSKSELHLSLNSDISKKALKNTADMLDESVRDRVEYAKGEIFRKVYEEHRKMLNEEEEEEEEKVYEYKFIKQ